MFNDTIDSNFIRAMDESDWDLFRTVCRKGAKKGHYLVNDEDIEKYIDILITGEINSRLDKMSTMVIQFLSTRRRMNNNNPNGGEGDV